MGPVVRRNYGGSLMRRTLVYGSRLIGRSAPYAAVGAMTRSLANKFRNRNKSAIEASANTFQHDSRMRYRRKRMPRGKRKAWKRFTRKVGAVSLGMQPLQIYTNEGVENVTATANQGTQWGRIVGGTNVTNNDELWQIFRRCYNLAAIANAVPYKIYIKSICMDVEITNTGSYPIILDVYTLQCRQDFATASKVQDQWQAALGEVQAPAGGGSVTTTKTALTVFDAPNFCSYWKVLAKREYIIGSNNIITLQMRIPMNKHIEGKVLSTSPQALPKYSRAFLITAHGCPSNRGGSGAAQFDALTMTCGWQTVVHYAVPPGSTTKEAGNTD